MLDKGIYSKKQIHILSKNEMDKEMKRIHDLFKKKENEETWEQFDQALKNIKTWTTVDKIYQYPGFVDHMRSLQQPVISALTSERTRLAGSANELLQALSKAMQRKFEIIHELFLPTLIQLFSRTNKLHLRNTLTCFKTIVENSKVPRTAHRLCLILRNNRSNNKAVRQHVTECLNTVIQVNASSDLLRYVDDIEAAIQATAMDPAPEVRSSIRMCYKLYCEKIPDRALKFTKSLSPTILRYLQVTTLGRSVTAGLKRPAKQPALSSSSPSSPSYLKQRKLSPALISSSPSTTIKSTTGIPRPKVTDARSIPRLAQTASRQHSHSPKAQDTDAKEPTALSSSLSVSTKKVASYLSATSSSSAKITVIEPSASSLRKQQTDLRTKYLGDRGSKRTFLPGSKLKRPPMIRGMPAMRKAKADGDRDANEDNSNNSNSSQVSTSPNKYDVSDVHHKQLVTKTSPSASMTTSTTGKRVLADVPFREEEMSRKRIKTKTSDEEPI